jgi:ERCC4-type nuclease
MAKVKEEKPPFIILTDTREVNVPPFPEGCVVVRKLLKEADYSSPFLENIARIERKAPGDLASTLSWGRERFDREVQRLLKYRFRCIVVEADLSEVYRCSAMNPNAILGSLASMYSRYDLPTFFAVNPVGAGRLIAGILRRLEERVRAEQNPQPPVESG